MNTTDLAAAIDRVAETVNLGKASARKSGRNPQWPYVPVVILPGGQQYQLKPKAFATRDEAVAYTERHLDAERDELARKLALPQYRALREYHGLPREVSK